MLPVEPLIVTSELFKSYQQKIFYNLGQNSLGKFDALICLCDKD